MRNYCTSTDEDFVVRLLAMHESMEQHCQPYRLWVLALRPVAVAVMGQLALPNVVLVPMEEVETEALRAAKPTRKWREYVWTVKSSWMLYLLDSRGLANVCYLDSDGYFFNEPSTMFEEIGDAPLAITPHRRSLPRRHKDNGIFNGGFVYAAQTGRDCIEEWSRQTIEWCYQRREDGKFVDQKYLNVWPEKWGAHVLEHRGVNLAPCNQSQYDYTLREGSIYIDEYPLIWYHFHRGLRWYRRNDRKYKMHPFVREYIYKQTYVAAMERAERRYDDTTTRLCSSSPEAVDEEPRPRGRDQEKTQG